MNFDELGIRKKDINEKRIDLIQRETSREFAIVDKNKKNFCKKKIAKMNPKIFFVVYTLGLDARVLTGKYQIKISKNSEKKALNCTIVCNLKRRYQ